MGALNMFLLITYVSIQQMLCTFLQNTEWKKVKFLAEDDQLI
jgi:hypothetical protein